MIASAVAEPRVLHSVPGRVRVHLPDWSGGGRREIESGLRQVRGVRRAQANPQTRNVLVEFDPQEVSRQSLLARLRLVTPRGDAPVSPEPRVPHVVREGRGRRRRARIAVRGLDRDPQLGRRVIDRLRRHPGVHAKASPLTGRVLVEFDQGLVNLEDLLEDVSQVELPPLPDEDEPRHPMDPAPLIQSATRAAAAGLGLALLTARQLAGVRPAPQTVRQFATISGLISIGRSFPAIRNGMRKLMGIDAADMFFSVANVLPLAFSESPLGLILTAAEALVLLNEVTARRAAWKRYEERIATAPRTEPGEQVRLDAGERVPRRARVVEGAATAINREGLPVHLTPGSEVDAGARLLGGPLVLELVGGHAFEPEPRTDPPPPHLYQKYLRVLTPASLAYALLTAVVTRSAMRTFDALLLVNPRPAIIGMETATMAASSRVVRGGVTVVGTRHGRHVRLPDVLLLDGPRVLTSGLEISTAMSLNDSMQPAELTALAAGIAQAAGSPWGGAFARETATQAGEAHFDGWSARAVVGQSRYVLCPPRAHEQIPQADRFREQGQYVLVLHREGERAPLGIFALRPRLSPGTRELVECCRKHGVRIALLPGKDRSAAMALGRRAGVELVRIDRAVEVIHGCQRSGQVVAFVSDNARGGPGFAACDLAIGLSSGRTGRFPARADLLAPDLSAVSSIVEAGARREAAIRDAVGFSAISNVVGAIWGLRSRPGVERASMAVYVAALAAIGDGVLRLSGGERRGAALAALVDPRPERWGRRNIQSVLRAFGSNENGLSEEEAQRRQRHLPTLARRHELLTAIRGQLRSPITLVLGAGAALSLATGDAMDAAILTATLGINVAIGAWQEREVGRAADALRRMSSAAARVLRDGSPQIVSATRVVPGDVLMLAAGDRVPADARLIEASGFEVDEASLTGESLPVAKGPEQPLDANRIVLEGSDVLVGTAKAIVVAVGRDTRMGAIAAALSFSAAEPSPLGQRLGQVLKLTLPLAVGGGILAAGAGLIRGRPLGPQLTLGVATAIAVIPEGLPLLAGVGQAGVARRLARRNALVRRLAAVEALGRVDVACADKTGTLTQGRLAVTCVAGISREATLADDLDNEMRHVLLTAALASPTPGVPGAGAHPTDRAVVRAAEQAGLNGELHAPRLAEVPFDPARSFHAAAVHDRLCIKGAPETLAPRCVSVRDGDQVKPLDENSRAALISRAQALAGRGLRVLMVAEGPADVPPDSPRDLTCLGFVGISDPLRPGVRGAVARCREAGVRVVMITGDHPATARAVAREAGVLDGDGDDVLLAPELAELENGELERRLNAARVIARATPLDKLRIVEGLRRSGHAVAMTGDGVNDAPALRLADVGVAMGRAGTEVARQAADLILTDDDFSTLVEALIEGRGFWRNMRRGIGLLLGGNLGELGLIVGANVLGFGSPLSIRQILVVNLITDALPALAVVLQKPEQHELRDLSREGLAALDAALRWDVFRRGASTAAPALGAFFIMKGSGGLPLANTVAFASIIATQLAQTLDAGRVQGNLSRSVGGAVGSSAAILGATLAIPPLRQFLGLSALGPVGWGLIGGAALSAVFLSRITSPSVLPQAVESSDQRLLPGSGIAPGFRLA